MRCVLGTLACVLAACGGAPPQPTTVAENEGPAVRGVDSGDDYGSALSVSEDVSAEFSGAFVGAMPVAVTSFGAAVLGEEIYLLGGYGGEPHRYNRTGQSNRLWRYSMTSREWEVAAELPHGIQGSPLLAIGESVCAFGGLRIDNAPGEDVSLHSSAEAACYTPATGAWRMLPPLPEGRSSADAALIGSTVCVVGGWKLSGQPSDGEWSDGTICLDTQAESPTWQAHETPFQRRALAAAPVEGGFVAIGGMGADGQVSQRTDVFDLESGSWRSGPDFPEPGFGASAASLGGSVYASGMSGTVYQLNDEAWQPVGSLAFQRFFHRLIASNSAVYALGGVGGMHTHGRVRVVESFVPTESRLSVYSRAFPGAARNRQGMFVDGEFLYLFGGNNSLEQHDFEPENFVSEGWRVHLPSMRIDEAVSFPAARQTMSVTSFGGRVMAVGGFGHDGEHAVSHGDVFSFADDTWSADGALPASRTQFGLAVHGDSAWIFGGLAYDPRREGEAAFDHVTSVLRRTGEGEGFEVVDGVELPGPRRAFAGAVHGDHYYLIGGMKGGFQLVEDCQRFSFADQSFEAIPCPAPRLSGDLIALGDKLVLFGGSIRTEGGITPSMAIEVFDPSNAEAGWQEAAQAPFDTKHARAFVYGSRLLMVSTHNEEGRLRVALLDLE